MRKFYCTVICFCIAVAGFFMPATVMAETAAHFVIIPVQGEIDPGTAAHVGRALRSAAEEGAAAAVLDIDTFGGRVDSATRIRDAIADAPLTVIAYVHPRAWSAGALIALAADDIIMAPGSSIGAAEPIPATEKTIAALRAEFAATAERNGRNPKIAAAMVDKNLGYPPYAAPGSILSLTETEATEAGLADGVAADIDELRTAYAWGEGRAVTLETEWQDILLAFLAAPWMQGLLISVIFVALMAEIKSAGFSGGGLVALIAGALLLIGQWQVGLAGWLEAALITGGIFIVLLDIFLIVSGFVALAGLILILGGLFLLLGADTASLYIIAGSLVVALAAFYFLAKYLPSGRLWRRISLTASTDTASGYVSGVDMSHYVGARGRTVTALRPAGTVVIGNDKLDVVTRGEFIPADTEVIVRDVVGMRIIVEKII